MNNQKERIRNFVESILDEQVTKAQAAIVLAGTDTINTSTNSSCINGTDCSKTTNHGSCVNNGKCDNSYNGDRCQNNAFNCPPTGYEPINNTTSCMIVKP